MEKLGKQPVDLASLSPDELTSLDELMECDALVRMISLDIYDLFSGTYDHMPDGVPILIPSVQVGAQRLARFSMNVYMINPTTPNKEAALKFLEYVASNLDIAAAYAMKPELNDPVEDPYFAIAQEELKRNLAGSKNLLETANPEGVRGLEDSIHATEVKLENEENYRWKMTTDNIMSYRVIAEHLYMPKSPICASGIDPIQRF